MAFDWPDSPEVGEVYQQDGLSFVYDGEKWKLSGSGVPFIVSPSKPVNVPIGQGWLNSSDGRAYVLFGSGVWLDISGSGGYMGSDVPIGIPFPTLDETPQANAAELDGSLITDGEADFPILAARLPWLVVSGGHIQLPDFRGLGIRGWDHGAGNDPDAASRAARAGDGQTGDYVGTMQGDGAPNVTGQVLLNSSRRNIDHGSPTGPFAAVNLGTSIAAASTGGYMGGGFDFDMSRVSAKYGAASEVRGSNINVLWQMRLY